MSDYQRRKNRAREQAQEWQWSFENQSLSYSELETQQAYFKKLAARYGLTEEFRENGII